MDDISGKWMKMANKTADKKETLSAISEKQAAARKKLMKLNDLVKEPKFERYIRKHTKEEYKALFTAIEQDGKVREPLTVKASKEEGKFIVVDGHHRLRVATELVEKGMLGFESLPVNIEKFEDDDEVFVWMLRNQLGRRNLSPFERAEIGFRITAFIQDLAHKKKQHQAVDDRLLSRWIKAPNDSKIDYAQIVSEITGVPRTTIIRAKKIHALASNGLKEGIRAGDISISKAYEKIVEDEKQKKNSERIEKRKKDFEKKVIPIKEIEAHLSHKLLADVLGLNKSDVNISVLQRSKNSLLYALKKGKELHYLRVSYQDTKPTAGLENFLIYLTHEGTDFTPPKGAGLLTISPVGKLKLIKKCNGVAPLSEKSELALLRSLVVNTFKD